jgi:hypothetical protein
MNGEWECVLATKQIFRSSPFFMAIQDAFGDATFGDSKSSEVFFRLHDLQVMSWGASTVGRVAQRIDMDNETMESDFDTILFRSTVIPILGWFKLLPTFGGRVVSFADRVKLDPDERAHRPGAPEDQGGEEGGYPRAAAVPPVVS